MLSSFSDRQPLISEISVTTSAKEVRFNATPTNEKWDGECCLVGRVESRDGRRVGVISGLEMSESALKISAGHDIVEQALKYFQQAGVECVIANLYQSENSKLRTPHVRFKDLLETYGFDQPTLELFLDDRSYNDRSKGRVDSNAEFRSLRGPLVTAGS